MQLISDNYYCTRVGATREVIQCHDTSIRCVANKGRLTIRVKSTLRIHDRFSELDDGFAQCAVLEVTADLQMHDSRIPQAIPTGKDRQWYDRHLFTRCTSEGKQVERSGPLPHGSTSH